MRLESLNLSPPRAEALVGKRPVAGVVEARMFGLDGDRHADPAAFGALSKAIYAYPVEHYPFWQTVRAQARVAAWGEALAPGSLGENLTLAGLLEDQVWIGDVLSFEGCELAVSEPRFPGSELNTALGFPHAAKMMEANGWCGFYLAVRTPGPLRRGQAFELIPGPREVGITELFRARVPAGRRG
jgi:MOSC domain-containing protein YiiM